MIFKYVAKVEFKINIKFSHLPKTNKILAPSLHYLTRILRAEKIMSKGLYDGNKVLLKGKVVVVFQLKL